MVPTSLAGFAFSLALLPRVLRALGPERSLISGLVILAAGQLWLAHAPVDSYVTAVLPALFLVAVGVAMSFTPTTMVIASAAPAAYTGLASGLAGSATQVGTALGTAVFTVVGVAVGGSGARRPGAQRLLGRLHSGAAVALATALLGTTIARRS